MLTLYHSPRSRSTRIIALLHELGMMDAVETRFVTIPRQDGSGARDPANPHPEGKVPLLVHDGDMIRESVAIILYLTDHFPQGGMGVPVGHPDRGGYLAWLAWYGSVMEPVLVHGAAGLTHPILDVTFRGMEEVTSRLETALRGAPWLMGDSYSAVDLLVASPFHWFGDIIPDVPVIRDWVARCAERPVAPAVLAFDALADQAIAAASATSISALIASREVPATMRPSS